MHATITGLRKTSNLFLIGVDRTQSIALDEVFSQKPIIEGQERETITLRTSSKGKETGSDTVRLDKTPDESKRKSDIALSDDEAEDETSCKDI